MKFLTTTEEGSWKERKDVKGKIVEVNAEKKEMAIANTLYRKNKPTLKEDDKYQLILCDIGMNEDSYFGVIHCKINDKQKEVKF